MFNNRSDVDKILSALGEQLEADAADPLDLLVCGGSALNALGLISRATKDVDVLAIVSHNPNDQLLLQTAKPLPPSLKQAASAVGRIYDLPDGWINPGPTSALDLGLPRGVLDRSEKRDYGAALAVRFLSRYDQIHFKLYAAADQAGKHFEDIVKLKPNEQELEAAAHWSMTHDVSDGYKFNLRSILIRLGFPHVAERI